MRYLLYTCVQFSLYRRVYIVQSFTVRKEHLPEQQRLPQENTAPTPFRLKKIRLVSAPCLKPPWSSACFKTASNYTGTLQYLFVSATAHLIALSTVSLRKIGPA